MKKQIILLVVIQLICKIQTVEINIKEEQSNIDVEERSLYYAQTKINLGLH